MTSTSNYLERVENELHSSKSISSKLCDDFSEFSPEFQATFGRALAFAGCPNIAIPSMPDGILIQELDRIRASRLMLLRLHMGTEEPRWSSWVLEQMWKAIMATPGGKVTDLFQALCDLLAEFGHPLTAVLGHFIKDNVIYGFIKDHSVYETADFSWIVERLKPPVTSAQAYFAIHAVPPKYISAELRQAILTALTETAHREIALAYFEDEVGDSEAK